MELREMKKRLREEMAKAQSALPQSGRTAADERIAAAVLQSDAYRRARSVFVYVSVQWEPDTRAILRDALESGKAVYVPKCYPQHRMEAVRIRDMEDMIPGVWSIPEPKDCAETAEKVDLSIVPCVTASPDGKRLGRGAGYYDRFLSLHRTEAMCLCYQSLLREEIPVNRADARMDWLVTEEGMTRCGA